MNKETTFEDFLKERHADLYIGTDDDMPDAYEEWLTDMDLDLLLDVANTYGEIRFLEGKIAGVEALSKSISTN